MQASAGKPRSRRTLASSFTNVPNVLMRSPGLSHLEVRIAMLLLSHDGPKGCFPMQATLAREAGVSDRSIRTTLEALAKLGLIRIDGPATERGPNRYDVAGLRAITEPIGPTGSQLPLRS